MTMLYPIVLETEDNSAVSAYVAARVCRGRFAREGRTGDPRGSDEYLSAHPTSRPAARTSLRSSEAASQRRWRCGPGGAKRSDAKARASRANGRLGGRSPKASTNRTARVKTSR